MTSACCREASIQKVAIVLVINVPQPQTAATMQQSANVD
jgi:hypothetical protein